MVLNQKMPIQLESTIAYRMYQTEVKDELECPICKHTMKMLRCRCLMLLKGFSCENCGNTFNTVLIPMKVFDGAKRLGA